MRKPQPFNRGDIVEFVSIPEGPTNPENVFDNLNYEIIRSFVGTIAPVENIFWDEYTGTWWVYLEKSLYNYPSDCFELRFTI